jgi:lysyl-tRNA synthetase, class II
VDIVRKDTKLQIVVNYTRMANPTVKEDFIARRKLLRRGDVIGQLFVQILSQLSRLTLSVAAVTGHPYCTESGQLSLNATELPSIISPCLHHFPKPESSEEATSKSMPQYLDRHVEMLMNYDLVQTISRRSQIIRLMREFLQVAGYIEVQTPILSAEAGGAIAKAFQTCATEFSQKQLSLRIAPELWLKRLIVGGMDRIFEIGPSFRNEGEMAVGINFEVTDISLGLDRMHNPEFTTCEFYCTYTSIRSLLTITENMLNHIVQNIGEIPAGNDSNRLSRSKVHPIDLPPQFFKGPYLRFDFILTLNHALGLKLPDLGSATATSELVSIFRNKNISLPSPATLPRMLDKLSTMYLEPLCKRPAWIINHPECLSPLSKSFVHPSPDVAQRVAARAELFVYGHEIVNCYEEENSPSEQRRKFVMQQNFVSSGTGGAANEETMNINEDYLKALEWGLPPTGGWGCGVDRLVMLLTGKFRINDVLTFGNLRAVTRNSGSRKRASLATDSTTTLKHKIDQPRAAEPVEKDRNDGVQVKNPAKETAGKVETRLDAAEEAFLEIKEKLIRQKRSRTT